MVCIKNYNHDFTKSEIKLIINLKIMNNFFDSKAWSSLKNSKIGIKISYDIVSKIMNEKKILFMNSDNSIDYDPSNFFSEMSEENKQKLYDVNNGDDKSLKFSDKYLMKKIGTSTAMELLLILVIVKVIYSVVNDLSITVENLSEYTF